MALDPSNAGALSGTLCDADRVAFPLRLYGTTTGSPRADGWQSVDLDGPYSIRSMQIGAGGEFVNEQVPFQTNTFLYYRGIAPPRDTNVCIQSRGVGEGFAPCAGRWWIRPIRLDVQMDVLFTPCPGGSVQQDTVDSAGLGNLHSHLGLKLLTMANDGGDPTTPAADTFYYQEAYRARKALVIYVPEVVYVGNGSGDWQNAGDVVIDQTTLPVQLGVTTFIQNNVAQYNGWHLPSAAASALGNGLDTLRPGDRAIFVGDTRWVGPVLIFNLSPSSPIYFTIEEYT